MTFKVETKLDLYCVNNRKERSEVIREAIKFYLSCRKGRVYRLNSIRENLENIKTATREI